MTCSRICINIQHHHNLYIHQSLDTHPVQKNSLSFKAAPYPSFSLPCYTSVHRSTKGRILAIELLANSRPLQLVETKHRGSFKGRSFKGRKPWPSSLGRIVFLLLVGFSSYDSYKSSIFSEDVGCMSYRCKINKDCRDWDHHCGRGDALEGYLKACRSLRVFGHWAFLRKHIICVYTHTHTHTRI